MEFVEGIRKPATEAFERELAAIERQKADRGGGSIAGTAGTQELEREMAKTAAAASAAAAAAAAAAAEDVELAKARAAEADANAAQAHLHRHVKSPRRALSCAPATDPGRAHPGPRALCRSGD